MFDLDKWQEIFITIKKNKLRTFLTVFGIGWGIFMIVILLGAGKGLQNGVERDFSAWATNSGFFWSRRTTISYGGFQPGRRVRFTNKDTEMLRKKISGLAYLAPRNQLSGFNGGDNVYYNNKTGNFSVYGDYPGYISIQKLDIQEGRFINDKDIEDSRKVAVIGRYVQKVLFEQEEPIGKYIKINGVNFLIVGVFDSRRSGEQADRDTQTIYTPFTTFQTAFNYGNNVGWYAYSVKDSYNVSDVEEEILSTLREAHDISPLDLDAIGSNNLEEEFKEVSGLFQGINVFTWMVGISTLLAGVIGVSNIMLIIVKERTKEIGIRKALGATPVSIISLIIQESIFLTTIGGYVALVTGVVLIEAIAQVVPPDGFMGPPEVDIKVAAGALGLLIIGGALAGILPARKAAAVSPIEAIRVD
ncbi:ABC transporter permease [Marivirga atlantica]|jgi:putative ABC transport system permease protein|uniref:ABC transporter permease n=1 Tax=Marivirga atlantica TaxID=1548457 RepID=A0A937AN70_9BACT|nr:ABC transporter permease [Marivirga atlantica]MBL0766603.1 ABC transporter permease [Marivirga atlantica]